MDTSFQRSYHDKNRMDYDKNRTIFSSYYDKNRTKKVRITTKTGQFATKI
ncbi:MAG: hypothetical protein ACXWVZ_04895 [Kaistella sp.]